MNQVQDEHASKPSWYYVGCNEWLLRAVPSAALRILEVGCAEGRLGAALKQMDPRRQVFGLEREPAVARRAAERLDEVFTLDVETEDPPIEPGTLDCILYGDVLEHLVAPWDVLRRHRKLLNPTGIILVSLPNTQHYSLLAALLTGDLQYSSAGLLDSTHLRFFTYSTFFKVLLDTGFVPEIADTIPVPCPDDFMAAAEPLLRALGLRPERTRRYLEAYQYIIKGTPLAYYDEATAAAPQGGEAEEPITFVACVSNDMSYEANLMSSPCLAEGTRHELLPVRGCPNAAYGLNWGIANAKNPIVVCLHQDVYLPEGWPRRFLQQYRLLEKKHGQVGVAGVFGALQRDGAPDFRGHVIDRDHPLKYGTELPAEVDTLDELLLAVPRGTPLRLDDTLGFHFYGADLCMAARQKGLPVAALDALCFHNSLNSDETAPTFRRSGTLFANKWRAQLPVMTSSALIDSSWCEPVNNGAKPLAVPDGIWSRMVAKVKKIARAW